MGLVTLLLNSPELPQLEIASGSCTRLSYAATAASSLFTQFWLGLSYKASCLALSVNRFALLHVEERFQHIGKLVVA